MPVAASARSKAPSAPAAARRWPFALALAALGLAIVAAYAGAVGAPFHFDDHESISGNPTIRRLAALDWLNPPAERGETVSGRPVLNFTFALNHALGALDPRVYRITNILIHTAAALVLFGIVRRSLALVRSRSADPDGNDRHVGPALAAGQARLPASGSPTEPSLALRSAAVPALLVAAIWALHPLHTGAVTYIVQRAESLAGLFYLLTLYGFIRGTGASHLARSDGPQERSKGAEPGRAGRAGRSSLRAGVGAQLAAPGQAGGEGAASCAPTGSGAGTAGRAWFIVSIACCLLGAGTKETLATAPVLVLLYDRAFVAGSFRAAWRARWRVHLALASSWLVLGALVLTNAGRGGSAGFGAAIDAWTYLLTQAGAIVRYLVLAFWPAGQVFDYGVPVAHGVTEVLPQLLVLAALAAAAGGMLWRNRPAGFLLAGFFLLLAPSSSIIPVATQTIAEHRMYLPLATIVALVGLAVRSWLPRGGDEGRGPLREQRDQNALPGSNVLPLTRRATVSAGVLAAAVAVALAIATSARNRIYRSELALWQDTAARRPDNPRGQHNLGLALANADRTEEAIEAFRRAIALQPSHAFAHASLAAALLERGDPAGAAAHFRTAVAADPSFLAARVNLGRALARLGQTDEAIEQYRAVLALEPAASDAGTNLAALLQSRGESAEAAALLRRVLAVTPDLPEAHYHLGLALEAQGDLAAAEKELRAAIALRPEWAEAHLALGNARARGGDFAAAERSYREAVRLEPRLAGAWHALGNARARAKDFAGAIAHFRAALAADPSHVPARNNLANALLVTGRIRDAIAAYEEVLQSRPNDEAVRRNLELARELLRTGSHGGP